MGDGAFAHLDEVLFDALFAVLDVVEFVLFIESLRGDEVDVDDIEPEVFTNVNSLYQAFFFKA